MNEVVVLTPERILEVTEDVLRRRTTLALRGIGSEEIDATTGKKTEVSVSPPNRH